MLKSTASCFMKYLTVRNLSQYSSNSLLNPKIGTTIIKQQQQQPNIFIIRHYAKGKDKKKDKGKTKVEINENELSEVVNIDTIKNQMQKAVEQLKDDFTKHLSLRSSAGSIESLIVEVDGEEHTLQEVAQIVRKNPKTIIINMAVFPQAIPAALTAIQKSGMNLNPQQEGTSLFIPIPKVTTEHRESLAKSAKTYFVKCKDSVRDVQNKQAKMLKRKDKLSEDVARRADQQITAIADTYIAQAEMILKSKQNELIGKD